MAHKSPVLKSVQDLFPKSAGKNVQIAAAWNPANASDGETRPKPHGSDGWEPVNRLATFDTLHDLHKRGFTYGNFVTSGVANNRIDYPILPLIAVEMAVRSLPQ